MEVDDQQQASAVYNIPTDVNYERIFDKLIPRLGPYTDVLDNIISSKCIEHLNAVIALQTRVLTKLQELNALARTHTEDFNNTAVLNVESLADVDNDILRNYNEARIQNSRLGQELEQTQLNLQTKLRLRRETEQASLERQFISMHEDMQGLEFFPEKIPLLADVPPKRKSSQIDEVKSFSTQFCVRGITSPSSLNLYALMELFKILTRDELVNSLNDDLSYIPNYTMNEDSAINGEDLD